MKIIATIITSLLFSQGCIAQKKIKHDWVIRSIATNYIEKGPNDRFELPNKKLLIGKIVFFAENLLISKNLKGPYFCSDTLILGRMHVLRRKDDDKLSSLYPGDELSRLVEKGTNDTCFIGKTFLSILGTKSIYLTVYELNSTKGELTNCKLFVINQGNDLVFFNENEFLLLKFKKK